MKSFIGTSALVGLAVATAWVVGCSAGSSTSGTGSSPTNTGDVGAIGLNLALPDGTIIDSVQYTLSNGTTTVQSGTLSVANSQGISFQLGSVAAGNYSISLSAASTDGGVTCLGTAGPFAVQAHATVNEMVQLVCQTATTNQGNLGIQATTAFCGTWNSVSTIGPGLDAAPTNGSEVLADGNTPIVVTATATGADPSQLVYNWTATTVSGNGVTLKSNVGNGTTSDTLTVTCNSDSVDARGQATLTLVVTDSLDASIAACPSSLSTVSTTVFCDKIGTCSAPTVNCGTATNLDCANLQTDPNNCGACGTKVPTGGVCTAGVPGCGTGTTLCTGACVNEQTDPNNCGSCGHSCGTGGSCVAGACVVVPTCNGFLAAHADGQVSNTCSATESEAFAKDNTGSCLGCLLTSGCLDITGLGGNECQDLTGGAGSAAETECLNVLECDLGINPVAHPGPASGLTANAFCGAGVTSGVCNTAPAGACVTQWEAGFPGQSPSQIQGEIGVQTFPGGMANSIATCANANCTQCF